MIDVLYAPDIGLKTKTRTYREEALKEYLSVEKQRKKRKKTIHKAMKKQLGYVRCNLDTILAYMPDSDGKQLLTNCQQRELETIQKPYDQQFYMYKNNVHSVDDWIASISQPYIRPIVRGKAGADVEFRNKVMTSVVNGYSFIEKMSFDSFNEGVSLIDAIENYRNRFDQYPEAVPADTIIRNQENKQYLKSKRHQNEWPKSLETK
jgi:IS5 family transposase